MTRRLGPLVALALLTLTACGGASDDKPDAATDKAESRPSASTSDEPTETAAAPRRASCNLKGKRAKVTLEDAGDALTVTFTGQPITKSGTALYVATVWDEAGEVGRQLGAKYLDGKQIAYFVFDFDTSEQTNLDGSPEVSGKTIDGTFPASALGDLDPGDVASWSAAFNVNGDDVGTCPGGYESLPFPG